MMVPSLTPVGRKAGTFRRIKEAAEWAGVTRTSSLRTVHAREEGAKHKFRWGLGGGGAQSPLVIHTLANGAHASRFNRSEVQVRRSGYAVTTIDWTQRVI